MIGKNMKVGAAVFGLALGGGLIAGSVLGSAGTSSAASPAVAVVATTPDSTSTAAAVPATPAAPATRETPLTGDVATQVTAAAQAAVPGGAIDRVETDNDGVYEAHVTGTIDQPQGGPGGPGGPGGHGGPGAGETALTGDTATKVTAAAQAAIPDGTIIRVETDSAGSPYEAHVTKADGTQVVVKVDANFAVTATEDMPAGGPNGGHHQGPPPAGTATPGQAATTTG